MKRRICIMLIMALVITVLSACNSEVPTEVTSSQETTESTSATETTESTAVQEVPKEDEYLTLRRRSIYADICSGMTLGGYWPENQGEWNEYLMDYGDSGLNTFAISDVDMDGIEELIVLISKGPMINWCAVVYEYDLEKEELVKELTEYPGIRFFDNGIAIADASHNHGLGDIIWPQNYYVYDETQNIYVKILSVDSWNKNLHATDYEGNVFPEEVDADGDGHVYMIKESQGEMAYMDYTEYEAKISVIMNGAKELEFERKNMSINNYIPITDEFIAMSFTKGKEAYPDRGNDMAEMFMNSGDNIITFIEDMKNNYGVTLEENPIEYYKCEYSSGNGMIIADTLNAGAVCYEGEKIGDFTILGIYPGMSEEEAKNIIESFGFAPDFFGGYKTGDALGNYSISYTATDGIIDAVYFGPFCMYVG